MAPCFATIQSQSRDRCSGSQFVPSGFQGLGSVSILPINTAIRAYGMEIDRRGESVDVKESQYPCGFAHNLMKIEKGT